MEDSESSKNNSFEVNKNYPFEDSKGIKETLKKIGYSIKDETSNKELNIFKFDINDNKNNQEIENEMKIADSRNDNTRKRLKTLFLETLRTIINDKLKKAGSKKFIQKLSQDFIKSLDRKENYEIMDFTYKKVLLNKDNKISDKKSNLDTIKYLDEHPEISINSEWNKIKNMKYKDLLESFFTSLEFENSIIELKNKFEKRKKKKKKVDINYIKNYIYLGLTYVDYFSKPKEKKTKKIEDSKNHIIETNIKNLSEYKFKDENSEDEIIPDFKSNSPNYSEFSFGKICPFEDGEEDSIIISEENSEKKRNSSNEDMNSDNSKNDFDDSLDEKGVKKNNQEYEKKEKENLVSKINGKYS